MLKISALSQMDSVQLETVSVLAVPGETQYYQEDAAALLLNTDTLNLRSRLRDLDIDPVPGVEVWWAEDVGEDDEYDFAIKVCEACFPNPKPREAKSVCTCE